MQWAIDEARFEPSNPPANTPQPPPAKKARAGHLDVLDTILGAPAPTSSASAASLVDAELSAYLQADVIGRAEPPTKWCCCQVPVVGCRSQALSQRL